MSRGLAPYARPLCMDCLTILHPEETGYRKSAHLRMALLTHKSFENAISPGETDHQLSGMTIHCNPPVMAIRLRTGPNEESRWIRLVLSFRNGKNPHRFRRVNSRGCRRHRTFNLSYALVCVLMPSVPALVRCFSSILTKALAAVSCQRGKGRE